MLRHTILAALISLLLLATPVRGSFAAPAGPNRAALVVRHSDGSQQTACVSFSEPSISGLELLKRAGLMMTINYNAGLGGAVCSINGTGCAYPVQDCFCRCTGLNCVYWAYYHWAATGWQYSSVGAGGYAVADGALEGWSWGPGTSGTSGTQPPAVTFGDICPAPTATPSATASPTATATATPPPTATPTPAATPPQVPSAPAGGAPQVQFDAAAGRLASGACTTLRWLAWDAAQVTLDGAAVLAQDQREVCPASTRRYTLVATNAAGQTSRDVTLLVDGPTATATPTEKPAQSQPGAAQPTVTPAPIAAPVTVPATARPTIAPPTVAAPQPAFPPGALALAQELPPPSAPAQSAPAAPTALTPTALPPNTPRPRTSPTPILLARAAAPAPVGGAGLAPAQSAPGQFAAAQPFPPRGFHLDLLVGYAAYLLLAGMLLLAGSIVARRRAT